MLDWQGNKKLSLFIRIICIVLTVTFLPYSLTWAGAGEVFGAKSRCASHDPSSVYIPQELGAIKNSYTSNYNSHKPAIHIKDAYANDWYIPLITAIVASFRTKHATAVLTVTDPLRQDEAQTGNILPDGVFIFLSLISRQPQGFRAWFGEGVRMLEDKHSSLPKGVA